MPRAPSDHRHIPKVGSWATDKLTRLGDYLTEYTKIMRKRQWQFAYVDAFAGAGSAKLRGKEPEDQLTLSLWADALDNQVQELIDGSPRVALNIQHPFTKYIFIEQDPKRLALLRDLQAEYGENRLMEIEPGDCNGYLQRIAAERGGPWGGNWKAVVFLDPFGLHVPWKTIESLARTRAVEVFINFPMAMAINRFLVRNISELTRERRGILDEYFGDPGWFGLVYVTEPDLFGNAHTRKRDDAQVRLLDWYLARLRKAFGFVSKAHLVTNSQGTDLYYLIFAGPNPTGLKIADYVLGADYARRAVPSEPDQMSLFVRRE